MIASTVNVFKGLLGAQAHQDSVVNNSYAVAEYVCFFHRVGRQYHGSVLLIFAVLEDVPELTTSIWVQSCCRFIKKDDFRCRNKTNCYRETSLHA